MDRNTLFFLYRLDALIKSRESESVGELFRKMCTSAAVSVCNALPGEIKDAAGSENRSELLSALSVYCEEFSSFLPDVKDANVSFINELEAVLKEEGYRLSDGVFRKSRRGRLFLIEAELVAEAVADDEGIVTAVRVLPFVRIADGAVRTKKGVSTSACGKNADESTVSDLKLLDKNAFVKTLRHLDFLEFSPDETPEITQEDILRLSKSAGVASSVCENRAIPAYYMKKCKKDFPAKKAFSLALSVALPAFVLIALVFGVSAGLGVYFAKGYKNIFGMFSQPYIYIGSAAVSAVYAAVVYRKARRGRY